QPAPAPEEPVSAPRDREADFRALFSRSTASDSAPARRDFSDFRRDTGTTDTPAEEPAPARRGFEDFSRGAEETQAEDGFSVEDSRVFDAPLSERSHADLFDDDEPEPEEPVPEEPPRAARAFSERSFRREETSPAPEEPAPAPKKYVYKEYVRPGNNLFRYYDDTVSVSQEEIDRNCSTIVETLAGFRVDAEVVKVTCGSAVTRYDIDIPRNIAVRSVIRHDQEIAMRLHARDGVNIYSNSEVGAISIEVPNSVRATVGIKSVLKADEYVNAKPTALMFAIGKDVEGRNVCGNIAKMKHILVAGSTGSGKSVCLNAMLISLICKYSPQDLRLILIDPKKVEFAVYDGLPHLMINEIIADAQKAVAALNWAIKEMERRYQLFEQKTRNGKLVHDVDEYNVNLSEGEEKLPKIVIVVDELADLMSVAKKDIEDRIQRLAQKARAAGIHLVIATQRPSVDVITGVIKGNLPTRIAFRVIQEVDSRTIIDSSGAEKLLGNGDMLYRTEGMFNCSRVQGAFLSSEEVQAVIEDIKAHNEAYFDDSVAEYINRSEENAAGRTSDDGAEGVSEVDDQLIDALRIVVKLGSASISLIQRKCSVGYNHAGKIIEWMEMMGYISPFDGKAKARTVLLTKEEFEAKYGSLDG
ncbi:MAG: DNA translocase FtsK, partial [Candidatus Gallimonas sp.]